MTLHLAKGHGSSHRTVPLMFGSSRESVELIWTTDVYQPWTLTSIKGKYCIAPSTCLEQCWPRLAGLKIYVMSSTCVTWLRWSRRLVFNTVRRDFPSRAARGGVICQHVSLATPIWQGLNLPVLVSVAVIFPALIANKPYTSNYVTSV